MKWILHKSGKYYYAEHNPTIRADLKGDVYGGGVDFNGDADYITLGDITDLDDTTVLTIACWVYTHDDTKDQCISMKGAAGPNHYNIMRDDSGSESGRTDTFKINVGDSLDSAFIEGANNACPANTWIHVAFTFEALSATGLRLYVNGVEDANSPADCSAVNFVRVTQNDLMIGRYSSAASGYWNGVITEFAVWKHTLSATEIALLANSRVKGLPLQVQPSDLTIYLPMDDQPHWTNIDGVTVRDLSGNGLDGTGVDADDDSYFVAEEVLSYPPAIFPSVSVTVNYAIFQFKTKHTNNTDNISATWNGQTSITPAQSVVYLQVYNTNSSTWETIDIDNSTAADTDFDLSGSITADQSYYYDTDYIVTHRVYQDTGTVATDYFSATFGSGAVDVTQIVSANTITITAQTATAGLDETVIVSANTLTITAQSASAATGWTHAVSANSLTITAQSTSAAYDFVQTVSTNALTVTAQAETATTDWTTIVSTNTVTVTAQDETVLYDYLTIVSANAITVTAQQAQGLTAATVDVTQITSVNAITITAQEAAGQGHYSALVSANSLTLGVGAASGNTGWTVAVSANALLLTAHASTVSWTGGTWNQWVYNPFTNRLDKVQMVGVAADYTISNADGTRTLNANATTLNEVADVLATLIEDLRSAGVVQ